MAQEPLIIEVPNLLRDKVSYGPDGMDQKALERLDASIVNDLKAEYVDWAQRDLAKLQDAFDQALAVGPGEQRRAAMQALFAVAHEIKGQGGSFHYDLMTTIGNQLSQFVEHRESFDEAEMNVVRVHIDALRMVIAQHLEGDGGAAGKALVRGLQLIIAKVSGQP